MAKPSRTICSRSPLSLWGRRAVATGVALVSATGCSMTMTITKPPPAAAASPAAGADIGRGAKSGAAAANQPAYLPDDVIEAGRPKTPVVNVFGEFTRPRRGAAALMSDPSLRQHTFVDAGYDADVSVDPAGQWMVFASARDGDRTQLYLQRLDGPAVTQLTNAAADDAQPCVSPDGKRIAFASNRSGRWHLYVMHVDGRDVRQVTDGDANDMHPSFSPDGSRLVYSSLPGKGSADGAGEQWELRVVDLLSREKRTIGNGLFPTWSPRKDADVIAFQRTRARGSRWFSLWTCELKSNDAGQLEASQVTEVAVSSNAALVSPAWSPDGKQLAFSSIVEPSQTRNGKPQGQQDIWLADCDGNNRRRLTDGVGTNLSPCWAVDNRVYFVSDRNGHECIWSASAETSKLERGKAKATDAPASAAAADPAEVKP